MLFLDKGTNMTAAVIRDIGGLNSCLCYFGVPY